MKRSIFLALAAIVGAAAPARADEAREAAGRKLALEVCVNCHVVPGGPAPVLTPPAMSFVEIAAKPDRSAASLTRFLAEPHGETRRASLMPPFLLPPSQVEAVVAYLLSLKPK